MPWQSINPLSEPKGLTMSCRREVLEAKDKLSAHNVSWRCPCCWWRLPVTSGMPFFEDTTWPHLALLAMWNCCEGVDVTTAVGALVNISNRHWTCICKESRGVFYVDSMWSPHLIEQQDWVRTLERHPDTRLVLAVDSSWGDS